jgi:hypothetical protein
MAQSVVLNKRHGGFGLSEAACELLGCEKYDYNSYDKRTAPELVAAVESLGERAGDKYASLVVVVVKEAHFSIEDYDGFETIVASNSPLAGY